MTEAIQVIDSDGRIDVVEGGGGILITSGDSGLVTVVGADEGVQISSDEIADSLVESGVGVAGQSGIGFIDPVELSNAVAAYLLAHQGLAIGQVFSQATAQSVWTITHSLGYDPDVVVKTNDGEVMIPDVFYPNVTTVRLEFAFPMTGTVRLS